jgi:hypothetical protein
MNTGYAILVKVVRLDQSYSFLLPFQTSTWLLLLAALLAVVLVLSLLDNFTRAARYRALEEHHGVERVLRKRRRERAMEHASESIFMLVGQVRPAAGGGGGRQGGAGGGGNAGTRPRASGAAAPGSSQRRQWETQRPPSRAPLLCLGARVCGSSPAAANLS